MLDMRNAFEVDYGTFEGWTGARTVHPVRGRRRPPRSLEGRTVVSFAPVVSGGEGAIYLREEGIDAPSSTAASSATEQVGEDHYDGESSSSTSARRSRRPHPAGRRRRV